MRNRSTSLRASSRCFAFLLFLSQLSALSSQLFAPPTGRAEATAKGGTITLETGEIAGAKFTLARPVHWNARLLLLAHGLRDADRPLDADFSPALLSYRTFLDEGWIVAATSYRRNGVIIADAIADLDALRDYLAQKFGAADRVLIEGESMGGLIATLMAEREPAEPRLYHGAIAIGATLSVQEAGSSGAITLQPRLPLLFLSNQSELSAPTAYVSAKIFRENAELRPALFRVARDGHVNLNQPERLAALRALNAWLDRGRVALPSPAAGADFFDTTVSPPPQLSQVITHPDARGFDARVLELSHHYGNVVLNAQPTDLSAIGVAQQQWLQLTVRGATYRVRLGHDSTSVKRGEWVIFPNADGFVWLARNFADAAGTARLTVGDVVSLRRYDDPK
ncbi:MAG: hypothetical protein EXS32_12405 [Opitutus sp.]|nr:hypothetical protein [Opitutus sp.]